MSKANTRQEAKPQTIEANSPVLIDSAALGKKDCLHILHVDDDVYVLEVTRQVLSMENNFEVEGALSVDEAFKKLEKQTYNAIVSDYEMPLKNGLDFLKELRDQQRDIPFILFTGKGREEVVVKALNLGADSYINKNGSPETVYCELADAINKTVERKRSRQLFVASESKYRVLVENSLQGILVTKEAPLSLVFANDAMGKLLGYSPQELMSLSPEGIMGLVHHQDRVVFFKRMENRFRGEPAESCLEFRAVRKDGSIIWLSALSNRVEYDGQPVVQGMFLDITERKKSEEIVRKSEERYRELANFLQEIVFETDMNGQLVFANERAAEISGYSLSEIEKGLNILQFIAPEDRERGTKIIQRLLAGGGCVPGEYTFVRKDGTTFPALITATSRISENKVTGLRGLVIDITARKKTEEAIRLSEEKYRSLFENASDVILTGDLSGKITATNEAIKKYGFQKEQVVGRNVREFLSIEDGVRQDKIFQEVSSGKSFSGEIEALVVIGKRTFEVKTDPLRIGDRVVGFQTILRDVTERTKTEEALLASQQKFKALFSANPDAAVFLDTDFHVVEANSRFSVLFGYSVDEIKGKIITDIIVPDDAIEESRSIRQKIISGPVEIVALRKRKDASQVPLFMSGGPVVVNGKTIGSIMVYKDISDIITVQEELSNALAKAEVLNEKLSVVGGFTRHDVRNKLSTINGNLYLAEKYAGDNPLLHNCLGQIKTAVSNTVRILDFAKDYEMLGSHERVTLDVGKAVDDAASLFTDLKGVKIVNECRGYSVQADAMLSTIFHNLIDNSLKYGQNLTQIKVYIRSNQHKSESIIYEDDGVGVDTERKKQLFTRGFGVGTGFGLYLIRRTCEIYGWTVQETGDPGKGAQFVFSIPNKQRAE